jgi:hypothetical protein
MARMEFRHLLYLVCGLLASYMGRSIAAHGGGDWGMWLFLAIPVATVFVLLAVDVSRFMRYGPSGRPPASGAAKTRGGTSPRPPS